MTEFKILLTINVKQKAGKKIPTGCNQTVRLSTHTKKLLNTRKKNTDVKLRSLNMQLSAIA
jgi:hypothetical protein